MLKQRVGLMANNYKNSKVDLANTNVTTLYTAPAATQAIVKYERIIESTIDSDGN